MPHKASVAAVWLCAHYYHRLVQTVVTCIRAHTNTRTENRSEVFSLPGAVLKSLFNCNLNYNPSETSALFQ